MQDGGNMQHQYELQHQYEMCKYLIELIFYTFGVISQQYVSTGGLIVGRNQHIQFWLGSI